MLLPFGRLMWNNSEFLWKPRREINSLFCLQSLLGLMKPQEEADTLAGRVMTQLPNLERSEATVSITVGAPPWSVQSQFDFYSSFWHKGTLEAIIWTFQYRIYRNLKMFWGLDQGNEGSKETRSRISVFNVIFCHLDRAFTRGKGCTLQIRASKTAKSMISVHVV